MSRKRSSSRSVDFRSIEEPQLVEIHKYQNGELREELSSFLDFNFPWVPRSLEQIKVKVDEMHKKDRTALFGIWSKEDEFAGLGYYSEGWDVWEPHISVIIWPKYRRKGYGSDAARLILENAFNCSVAHVVSAFTPEWNTAGVAFAESLGFKKAGIKRRAGILNGKFFNGIYFDILREEYLGGDQ